MKKSMLVVIILALLAILVPYGSAAEGPDTQSATPAASASAADLEAKGDALRRQKEYTQAIQSYKAALRKDKNNAALYNKIGLAELQMQLYRQARSDFEAAMKRDPNFASAMNNAGVSAYALKNYGTAVKYFKRALALNEGEASFHANLGAAWYAQEKLERAIAEYQRAMDLDPSVLLRTSTGGISAQLSSPEERARYSYLMAKLYAKRGDVDNALQLLAKAKEEGYGKMGDVYVDQEFASLRQDTRLFNLIPPPPKR
jgi:tetratricopeptide (TPR) repeat protein